MFKEDTELGKQYVFDVKLTCKEVYDNSRRTLHQRGIEIKHYIPIIEANENENKMESQSSTNEKIVDKKIAEALTCKICMDQQIDTLFLPCGHFMFCNTCASK
jgi:E3 ubiquitin-protein ligase MYLIP